MHFIILKNLWFNFNPLLKRFYGFTFKYELTNSFVKLSIYLFTWSDNPCLKFEGPTSELSLYREPSFGHGGLRVVDESRAHWSWHRNNDSQSLVANQVWVRSNRVGWLQSIKTAHTLKMVNYKVTYMHWILSVPKGKGMLIPLFVL